MALIELLIERFALHNQDLWPFCPKRCADFASPRALNGVQTLKSPDFSEIYPANRLSRLVAGIMVKLCLARNDLSELLEDCKKNTKMVQKRAMVFPLLWVLHTDLIGRTVADGPISTAFTTTTTSSKSSSPFIIEPVCTKCNCNPGRPQWKGQQSLESCALTCAQEGSWFRHASGTNEAGNPGPLHVFG